MSPETLRHSPSCDSSRPKRSSPSLQKIGLESKSCRALSRFKLLHITFSWVILNETEEGQEGADFGKAVIHCKTALYLSALWVLTAIPI